MNKSVLELPQAEEAEFIDRFHKLVYEAGAKGKTWGAASYMGNKLWKFPSDLQLYQELIWDLKPKLIIETGTAFGGSALYFAHLLDQLGSGKVVSIDIQPVKPDYPRHPRITYLGGQSSTSTLVLRDVQAYYTIYGGPTLVILDSDHSKAHVLAELNAYRSFVSPGGYLVVEDTNINGHPAFPDFGPGPYEALEEWLPRHIEFKVDERRQERYLFTFHTWLRRLRV